MNNHPITTLQWYANEIIKDVSDKFNVAVEEDDGCLNFVLQRYGVMYGHLLFSAKGHNQGFPFKIRLFRSFVPAAETSWIEVQNEDGLKELLDLLLYSTTLADKLERDRCIPLQSVRNLRAVLDTFIQEGYGDNRILIAGTHSPIAHVTVDSTGVVELHL